MPFEAIPAPEVVPEHFRAFVEGSSPEDYARLELTAGELVEALDFQRSLVVAQFLVGTNSPPTEKFRYLFALIRAQIGAGEPWEAINTAFAEYKLALAAMIEQPPPRLDAEGSAALLCMGGFLSGWLEDDDSGQDLLNRFSRYVQSGLTSL